MSKAKFEAELQDINDRLAELTHQKILLEKQYKSRKGVLKNGEALVVTITDHDGCVTNLVFYMFDGVMCLNGYVDAYTPYVSDIISACQDTHAEKIKSKKMKLSEACQYL